MSERCPECQRRAERRAMTLRARLLDLLRTVRSARELKVLDADGRERLSLRLRP